MSEKLYLEIAAQISGWTYFIAWTISFCPQVYLNCKRKGVVGFSFDFSRIYLNYKRKLTEGWSIEGIWLDFTGGLLSAVQMLLYCVIDNNTQLTGNTPKLLLSCEALSIDTIFVMQHYILYPVNRTSVINNCDGESKPLIVHTSSIQYNSV